jgi:hypothetical protein
MITAAEARQRAQNSQESVAKFIEVLSVEIEKAADKGLFEYRYQGGLKHDPIDHGTLSIESFMTFKIPQFWELVMAALEQYPNSYKATVVKGEPYVPRGLSRNGDGEDGPQYISYFMKITW